MSRNGLQQQLRDDPHANSLKLVRGGNGNGLKGGGILGEAMDAIAHEQGR